MLMLIAGREGRSPRAACKPRYEGRGSKGAVGHFGLGRTVREATNDGP